MRGRQTRWDAVLWIGVLVLLGLSSPAARASASCTTIARSGALDPAGDEIKRFRESTGISVAGDVLYVGQSRKGKDKVYLYSSDGSVEIVATEGELAPNGGLFTASSKYFDRLSLSDNGHLAFFSPTTAGRALFARASGGALATVAQVGQVAPGTGGLHFLTLPSLSRINAAGEVAFVATLDGGGSSAVFRYDAQSETLAPELSEGTQVEAIGRSLCNFVDVDLSDSGHLVVVADANLVCGDNQPRRGIFLVTADEIETVALIGDPAPVPPTIYEGFLGAPRINASDDVAFRSDLVDGAPTTFLWSSLLAAATPVFAFADPTPLGGIIRRQRDIRLGDGGEVYLNALFARASEPFGVLAYDPLASPLLVRSDPTPSDVPGGEYKRFGQDFSLASDTSAIALQARVRPAGGGKVLAILRCEAP